MIYLFNLSKTQWGYTSMGKIYAKLTSNRTNKSTKKEEFIGIAIAASLPVDTENLSSYINMTSDCQLICDKETIINFRHKDLKPWIAGVNNTSGRQFNTDVFLATLPLNGGIVKDISGVNVLGYKIINNEFIIYFTGKHKQNTYETPVITIYNSKEKSETDYVFEKNTEDTGYHVITNIYNSDKTEDEIKPMRILRFRLRAATKLIFVKDENMNTFNETFGTKYSKAIVIPVNESNIDSFIAKYKEDGYKAASFFTLVHSKDQIDMNDTIFSKITNNFLAVNAVLGSKYISIIK